MQLSFLKKKRFYPLFFTQIPLKRIENRERYREERNDDDDDYNNNTDDEDEAKSDV